MTSIKPEIALIDGDIFRYEIGSIEVEHPFVPDLKIPAPYELIIKSVDDRIQGILDAVGCMEYAIYITGKDNFRFEVAKLEPYKGHRAGKEKPANWSTVDERLRKHWNCIEVQGNEADDVLALTQRAYMSVGTSSVICSRDKDLRMVEGFHYSWACGENQPEKPLYWITAEEAEKFFYKQLLTGDGTDNIMGCGHREDAIWKTGAKAGQAYKRRRGIGDVGADKALACCTTPEEYFSTIKMLYQLEFQDKWSERLLEMGQLLYIGQTKSDRWQLPTFLGEHNDPTIGTTGSSVCVGDTAEGCDLQQDQRTSEGVQ